MNYDDILVDTSLIDCSQSLYKDYIKLDYPQNLIFTFQLVIKRLKELSFLYEKYPYAELYDISKLESINWQSEYITFDNNFNMIHGPIPLVELENIYRRLNYKDAENFIFGINCLSYFKIYSPTFLLIFIIIIHMIIGLARFYSNQS